MKVWSRRNTASQYYRRRAALCWDISRFCSPVFAVACVPPRGTHGFPSLDSLRPLLHPRTRPPSHGLTMHGKVVVCLLLVLLDYFAVGSFVSDIGGKINESADTTDEDLAKVMYLLADEYTPQCLWVVVSDSSLRQQPWRHSYLALDPKDGKSTIDYINKNTERVTLFSCFTFLMTRPPDSSLMPLLTDSSNMQLTRYFIIQFPNESEAHDLLLDKRLIDEENVAALVKTNTREVSYRVMIRQLFHSSGFTQVLFINGWEKGKGFDNSDDIFPEQMKNFYGTKMRGVTLDFRPFTDYSKVRGSRVVVPKPSLDVFMLEVIADKLNFTYELVMPEDGLWGYLRDDGHWVGVVGDVEFRRANFSLVLSLTLERIFSVDFTRIYYNDPLSFVTAKSRPSPPWLKLIKPFSSGVWLLALFSIVTAVILYYIIYRAQALLGTHYLVPSRAFMHIFGSFVNQSLFTIPWLSSGRVFLGFWLLYGLLITTYYKTSLTAALAVPFVPPTLDTLHQLMRSNLKFGMIDAKGSEYQLFSTSNVPLYKKMFQEMSFLSSSESMEKVQEGSYAYIYFKSNLNIIVKTEYTNANGETNFHVATEEFFPGGYAWAFPKGVPYRKTFDGVMAYCLQAGLIDKWERDLYSIYLKEAQDNKTPQQRKKEKMEADAKRNDGQVVLNLNHLQGPFLILLLGSGSGVLLLLLEFFVARMLFAFPTSSRGFSPFSQKTLMKSDSQTPSEGRVVSRFDEKGNYVIRAVLKGN
ncbi:hypothetical protein O3P69_005090 [Scylla paramamosain]|uniref:Uncharacterized protein n=1 Tax=Scylla paramamosain TaxID=85552 RepID=A0AAW0UF63_SCYPA